MTEFSKTNVFNMVLLSAAIIGYAVVKSDPLALIFLAFPALIAYVNVKGI